MDSGTFIQEKVKGKDGVSSTRKWIKGGFLGKGGFAKVYEMTNAETRDLYAAKVIPKESLAKKRARQKLISEIKIHKSIDHKGVVGFKHYFEDSKCVYILLELCPNQSLNELLKRRKRLHEIEVRYYTNQIIQGLEYLHKNRVIHRDLKLGNLFINEGMDIKLGDFGLATKLDFDGERKRTIWGTPNYIAPEVLEGRNGHSYEVDIWSLGVIIYTLIVGKPPFETSNVKSTYDRIRKNSYHFPEHVKISHHAKDLIKWILHNNPARRPNLEDIKGHDFMALPIPKKLHPSWLACPPSNTFIQKYTVENMTRYNTAPNLETKQPYTAKEGRRELIDLTDNLLNGVKSPGDRRKGPKNAFEDVKLDSLDLGQAAVPVHAKKWIDYTSKYGLGYVLSDGSIGVFFNDATKIILEREGKNFEYYEKQRRDDSVITHQIDDYPASLEKKVTLLHHFKNYLDQNFKEEDIEHSTDTRPLIYIKKWIKTRHAKMFRLSNKVVQVYFKDKTEILLCSNSRQITYTNKEGKRATYPLSAALEWSNEEMNKRMQYTKNILTHLLQSGPSTTTARSSSAADGPTRGIATAMA